MVRRAGFLGMLFNLVLASSVATAGSVAGTGGATEVTQIVNMAQLAQSYGQQIISYENQLLQYETMVRNLAKNPLGVIPPDLNSMVQGQARLMAMGRDISSSMSKVDSTFAQTFNSPIAASFANKFSNWTNSSQDALKSAMLNAGLQRENFSSDRAAIQKLVDNVSASDGAVGGLQALGSLNAAQIQESMKLRDLVSQQQVAQNTYLAAQTAKEQARQDDVTSLGTPYAGPIPSIERKNIVNWNSVFPKK